MENLEELEKKLYKENETGEKRASAEKPKAEEEPEIRGYWEEEKAAAPGGERLKEIEKTLVGVSRVSRKVFWVLIGLFAAAIAVSGFLLFQYLTGGKDVVVEINVPKEIPLGKPFDLAVKYDNASASVLRGAKIYLNLPEGAVFLGESEDKRTEERSVGDIGVGASAEENFRLLVLKDPKSVKRFNASLGYSQTLGTRFEKKTYVDSAIVEPAIVFDFEAPEKILNNEEYELRVSYKNAAGIDYSDVAVELSYPPVFSFAGSDLKPDSSDNFWKIGELKKDKEGDFAVRGHVFGPEQSFFSFAAKISASFLGRSYVIDSRTVSLSISPSPLALSVVLINEADYAAKLGDRLEYSLLYRNNTDVGLKDAVIKAKLAGAMFDFSSVQSEAFFSSVTNTLTWNAANTPSLQVLPPGASGEVKFAINARRDYPIKRLGDKNYTLKVDAEIDSPTVPYFLAAQKTVGVAALQTKVSGLVSVGALAYFRDAASGMLNAGPIPPKVNAPTNYTIHWVVKNYSTDVRDAEVRAFLQSGVRWTGKVKSNIASVPSYNERTQEVVWPIGKIIATKGVIDKPLEAIFQIEATPSVDQTNRYMPLLSETAITAFDEFINAELRGADAEISTLTIDDPTVSPDNRIVKP